MGSRGEIYWCWDGWWYLGWEVIIATTNSNTSNSNSNDNEKHGTTVGVEEEEIVESAVLA